MRCEDLVLRQWSGTSSLADPGGSERRELGDGRLAERSEQQHPSNALVERGSGNMLWDTNKTSGARRAVVASRVRILIGLMRRSRLQRTTTGLISCDTGEHCFVSLRAGNKRPRSEDIPPRWNRCRHHLREECCWKTCFLATRWISFGVKCVETVLGNVGHGTRRNVDLNLVASVTVLLAETWYFVDLLT